MRNRNAMFIVVIIMMGVTSSVQAMDVYDWRANAENICHQSSQLLLRPISETMAGGRPENLVVERLQEAVPGIQDFGKVDKATAQIIIKSIVHSYFTDKRLSNPLNVSISSYQKIAKDCMNNVVRYDPDGKKYEAYQKYLTSDEYKKVVEKTIELERAKEEAAMCKMIDVFVMQGKYANQCMAEVEKSGDAVMRTYKPCIEVDNYNTFSMRVELHAGLYAQCTGINGSGFSEFEEISESINKCHDAVGSYRRENWNK